MKTSKKLSSISFNTERFLKLKLEELKDKKAIRAYFYIKHKAEEDTTKDHIHLLIEPAITIDSEQLKDFFNEFTPLTPTKELGCLPFQITKNFQDWYLYALHDIDYLCDKGLIRKYHYQKKEVIASDIDYLDFLTSSIDYNTSNRKTQIKKLVNQGWAWESIVLNTNIVPLQQLKAYKEFYDMYYIYASNNNLIVDKEKDITNANLEELMQH